jgi:hypothetical protein
MNAEEKQRGGRVGERQVLACGWPIDAARCRTECDALNFRFRRFTQLNVWHLRT